MPSTKRKKSYLLAIFRKLRERVRKGLARLGDEKKSRQVICQSILQPSWENNETTRLRRGFAAISGGPIGETEGLPVKWLTPPKATRQLLGIQGGEGRISPHSKERGKKGVISSRSKGNARNSKTPPSRKDIKKGEEKTGVGKE